MTDGRRPSLNSIAIAAVALLLAAGCGGGRTRPDAAASNVAASPRQLTSIRELRSVFNAASREPTLVVLVAPT